jgi:hypothetical protein
VRGGWEDICSRRNAIYTLDIEKFNGHNIGLEKLTMEYLLIEREIKEVLLKDTKPNIVK